MSSRIRVYYLCFLVSGFSALVYEIIWQRMLTLVFGVSTFSVAAVLTAFMAGLALGSWWFGRIADRVVRIAHLYGLIEIGIAVTGLAVSYAIDPLMRAYVSIAHAVEPGFFLSNLIRFGLALAVFIVPSTLIGATVPVMSRLVTRHLGSVGIGFGRFYAINTAGAVMGAGVAGFVLLRLVGMHSSVYVAVAGNVLAATVALVFAGTIRLGVAGPSPAVIPAAADPVTEEPADHSRMAILVAGLVGFTGLGYEVAWSRLLAVYTLNSVYSFTMLLTVFLTGLAAGSAIVAWLMRRWRINLLMTLALVQMVLAMTCPAVLAFTRSAVDVGYEYQYRSGAHVFFLEYVVTTVMVLGPTLLMGMTLPLLVGLVTGGDRAPGRTVGTLYAINSLGTIVGAGLTGMVLIPYFGLRTTMMLFAVCNFSIGAWAATGRGRRDDRTWRTLTPAGCVCFVVLSLLVPFGARFIRPHSADEETVLYYAEGNAAIAHIVQNELGIRTFRVLYVDSESVAGSSDEVVTDQKMLAHLPLLLHPDPKRALTVGFGTGGTSYSMLLHRVETHCVEIEKAVPAGAHFFHRQNHGVVNLQSGLDPNRTDYRLIIDDARSWFYLAPQPYDVIVDDLTSIQYRGNGNLYTVECFELIKRKLTPNGVGCAWIPIMGIEPGPLHVLIRSFREVFPHTSIWYMNNLANDFAILVGTPERLRIDLADWAARMSEPEIREDLEVIHLADPYKLAHCLLVAEDEIDAYLGEGPVHTDDQPILDFLTHAGVYRDTIAENLRDMLDHRAHVQKYIRSIPEHTTPAQFEAEMRRWDEAVEYLIQGHMQKRGGSPQAAGEAYREAAERVPYDPGVCELAGRKPVSKDAPVPEVGEGADSER